jgi:hypothetical protein
MIESKYLSEIRYIFNNNCKKCFDSQIASSFGRFSLLIRYSLNIRELNLFSLVAIVSLYFCLGLSKKPLS